MAVRKVVTRSSCHFRGYFPSLKNGHSVGWESQLEGGFFRLLELSPCVRSYEAQPTWEKFNVDGSLVKYAPDIRAFLMDGSEWWFEVKPKTELLIRRVKQKLDAAKIHFSASGRSFSVVTDALIWSEPSARNLHRILYHRRGPLLSPTLHAEVRNDLDKYSPKDFGELIKVFGEMDAWRLLGLCIVGIDVQKPLTESSEVFLNGGHRHADLFT